jgi:two-component system NtrC family response regulator
LSIKSESCKKTIKKKFVINALRQADYNIAAKAKNIGISRPTLYDMMKKHDIAIKTVATLEK